MSRTYNEHHPSVRNKNYRVPSSFLSVYETDTVNEFLVRFE